MKKQHTNGRNAFWLVGVLALAGLVAGCGSTTMEMEPTLVGDDFSLVKSPYFEGLASGGAAAPTIPTPAVPAPAPAMDSVAETAPVPPPPPEEPDPPLPTKMIKNLSLPSETEVAVVLRALAKAGEQNILISKGVEGTISFSFDNVPWDQAFRGVLAASGLTYVWEGQIIRVMTPEDMKRELEIEQIEHQRKSVAADMRKVAPLLYRVIKVRYTNAAKLAEAINKILAASSYGSRARTTTSRATTSVRPGVQDRATITANEDNNTLVIRAIKEDLDKLSRLVADLDRPKAQILIEARIVEANRSTARELGIQWGGNYDFIEGDYLHSINSRGAESGLAANFPAAFDNDAGFSLGLLSQSFGGGELLNLQLSALQEEGQINILSSPSITTLDNETATIESGEERAYRETSGTGNDLDVSIEWKKAVLKLEVTPHVIDAETLRLKIEANKDSFDDTKQESNGEFPVNTKNAKTTILLRNGQTTVIGGLSQETKSESESGVPFLRNIPILGYLFKGSRKGTTMDEVLIFITPRRKSSEGGVPIHTGMLSSAGYS